MDPATPKFRSRLLAWLCRSRPGPIIFVKRFPYKDIKRATDGFQSFMYTNSHIAVYKARFQDGGVSLIKEIRDYSQAEHVFYREVQLLGRLHHRHLLALRGFSTGHKRFLVFDNIERGSLKEHLNDPLRTPLNWRTRLQIAIGVVAALEYLLVFNEPPMFHVSISSSNIMLDENFNAKLSDIGLQSSGENYVTGPHTSCPKDCMGQKCGNIMFQLGVLILELITGQSSEDGGELKSLLAVAKLCVKSGGRPTISILQILRYLQNKLEISRD
ncbi:hypothetical protein M0R45_015927 [Rubus argutus]|uniref:Protein kinase domain-containing protein n=1 Tax=Rubus argutus TaxID=59490 RepID=A0AAW1XSF6_RUBAR